jgi:hypothetical protein
MAIMEKLHPWACIPYVFTSFSLLNSHYQIHKLLWCNPMLIWIPRIAYLVNVPQHPICQPQQYFTCSWYHIGQKMRQSFSSNVVKGFKVGYIPSWDGILWVPFDLVVVEDQSCRFGTKWTCNAIQGWSPWELMDQWFCISCSRFP